ncbi:MAG: ATP-grasp domain-containing protein [Lactobacillaceae bacterium]|nr:ATP-grasp domain-containing protein [Lactobacillaceae bacterium]
MMKILPGSTIGIIGNRETTRYVIQAAHNMGYTAAVYSDNDESQLGSEADFNFVGSDSWETFLGLSTIVTYNDAWLPFEIVEKLNGVNLPQGTALLELTDDHSLSRSFFDEHSINTLPYKLASTLDEIAIAATALSYPVVVKSIFKHGNHSKSIVLNGAWDLGLVAPLIDGGQLLIETWLPNVEEYTLSAVRDGEGELTLFPVSQLEPNEHKWSKLWTANQLDVEIIEAMQQTVNQIADQIHYVGAFTVAFLYSSTGNLYIRDVFAGIGDEQFIYAETTNSDLVTQHLRALTGQALSSVIQTQTGIYQPLAAEQIEKLYEQWTIKPDWKVSIYRETQPKDQAGHVIATGTDLERLNTQLDVSEIWKND